MDAGREAEGCLGVAERAGDFELGEAKREDDAGGGEDCAYGGDDGGHYDGVGEREDGAYVGSIREIADVFLAIADRDEGAAGNGPVVGAGEWVEGVGFGGEGRDGAGIYDEFADDRRGGAGAGCGLRVDYGAIEHDGWSDVGVGDSAREIGGVLQDMDKGRRGGVVEEHAKDVGMRAGSGEVSGIGAESEG